MKTNTINTFAYLLQLLLLWELTYYTQAYWIRDLSYCPRKREVTRQRHCFKSCFDDGDCQSRYRSCVCDYDCGMSCVKRGVTCPYLTPPDHGKIIYSNENRFSSRATYECDPGYVLEGPIYRYCQGDMWWGPINSVSYCTKEVFCNQPPDIINAVNDVPSTITTFHAGYSIKYTCLPGYVGNGTAISECTFLGQWTFATLKCTPLDCGSPGVLRNGFFSGERFDYPNIIAFFCNEGFELVGTDTTRACQENGLWSGTMPYCQKKNCGSPPLVSYAQIIQPDRTTNDTVQYICQDGYQLLGSTILKCVLSQWQPSPPTCEPIVCANPSAVFNGYIEPLLNDNASSYPIDSVVKFHCPSNLILRGSHISKCQMNGSWTPSIPKCDEPIPCTIPSLPTNGRYRSRRRLPEQMNDGSQLEYTCNNSQYRRRIFCRQGKILPRMPKCFNDCRVENGDIIFSKEVYRHREKVHYACRNHNTSSFNNETILCMNGQLSKQVTCPKTPNMCVIPHALFLRNIANTSLPAGSLLEIGSFFSYTCIQDYQPVNQSTIIECLDNGKLSHHAYCVPKSCTEHPPLVANARTIYHSTTHGSLARFKCYPGYKFENNNLSQLTCQFGLWLPKQLPKCLPIFCSNPGPLQNGRVYVVLKDERISSVPIRSEFRSYIPTVTHGRIIEFECNSGYVLNGPSGLTCNHGQWMPAEKPRCIIDNHIQPKIAFTG